MFVLNENMEVADVEWEPCPIHSLLELGVTEVIVSGEGYFLGFLYILKLSENFKSQKEI